MTGRYRSSNRFWRRHPNDPFAVNHLLTAILFRELYRMGVLNTGEYANDSFISAPHRPADPKVKQQIRTWSSAPWAWRRNASRRISNDVDALYARGVTRAQFSTYTALIERAWFSALRNAVGARRDHERVLELSPSTVEAKLIVGAHNYVVGSLPWGVKAAASWSAWAETKTRACNISKSVHREAARPVSMRKSCWRCFCAASTATTKLCRSCVGWCRAFPQDVLLALEEGHLLRAAGRNQEAAAVYGRIWQAGKEGKYPGLHYEIAALSLGDLLRSEKNYSRSRGGVRTCRSGPAARPGRSPESQSGRGRNVRLAAKARSGTDQVPGRRGQGWQQLCR